MMLTVNKLESYEYMIRSNLLLLRHFAHHDCTK